MRTALRTEVQEFLSNCEKLIECAHDNKGALSREECELVRLYARELELEIAPYCDEHYGLAA
jgi:hypothetical protein